MDIENTIAGIIADVAEIDRQQVTPDAPLHDLGVDSLMSLEITVRVEQKFGVHFAESELQNLWTLADVVKLVHSHLEPRQA
jgi:acyl carrier protein